MGDEEQPEQPEAPGGWLPPRAPGPPPPVAQPAPPPPTAPQPPQPPQQFPPPSYQPQAYPYPYPPQQPAYYQPLPPQPPNNDAVVGFTCAVVGAALLVFTAGLATIVSLVLGIVAIPYSRKGKRVIAEGKTRKHKDLANSGFVIGIIVTVLSVLATIAWVLIFALFDWDELDDSSEDRGTPALLLGIGLKLIALCV